MLRITIDILPKGDPKRARHMGTGTIALTGASEDGTLGSYDVMLSKWGKPKRAWKKGKVDNFPRIKQGPWDLLLWALAATIGDRVKQAKVD